MKQYDYLIFIGRFQPYHAGHHHVVQEALKLSENLIFVIGSHDKPRCIRNPFTTEERIQIIKSAILDVPDDNEKFSLEEAKEHFRLRDRIHFCPQVDYTYNDEKWISSIQASVNTVVINTYGKTWEKGPARIGIVGYDKDHSSYYLKKFPQWKLVEIKPVNEFHATDVRKFLFGNSELNKSYTVNQKHYSSIVRLSNLPKLVKEYEFIQDYKKQWENSPYPPVFMTVDAVVTQSGHILVVERGAMPGEGLLALPGGFVNNNETLKEAVIRELYEETRIDVPKPVLIGSIHKTHTFDDPHRSQRGRTTTQTYHFRLNDMAELPRIKGSDDARKAKWISLSEFASSRNKFFEDHMSIVEFMLGL